MTVAGQLHQETLDLGYAAKKSVAEDFALRATEVSKDAQNCAARGDYPGVARCR